MVVISDKKIGVSSNGTTIDYYTADVISATDYYPFGFEMPGRKFNSDKSVYGFNGKRKDNEIYGEGNAYDFEARIQDPRLGKFLSVDPMYRNFPNQSPYLFAGNSPIKFIDEGGLFKLDPSLEKTHPLIYKYLSSQIESDVMSSAKIINSFKTMNPNLTDNLIRGTFANNSGPTLISTSYPGGQEAGGYYDYDSRMVEVNTKILNQVEGILASNKSSDNDKLVALTMLYQEVIHEGSHDLNRYGGSKPNGDLIIKSKADNGSSDFGIDGTWEPGLVVEDLIWGTAPEKSEEDKKKPDAIPGVSVHNAKFKKGVTKNTVEQAQKTEAGKSTLPTVPKKPATTTKPQATATKPQNKKKG